VLGGAALLLAELRFEHREVLGETWHAWLPLGYAALLLIGGGAALLRWQRGGRRILAALFAPGFVIGALGIWFHSGGHSPTHVFQVLSVWHVPPGQNGGIKVGSQPPTFAPAAFWGLALIGLIACFSAFFMTIGTSPASVHAGGREAMAELKSGRIVEWHRLSPSLSLFRLVALEDSPFPPYQAGQYIALRRDDCLLTRKVKEGNEVRYLPDLDAEGRQKRGPVTHSYSISSAPFETAQGNYLEFYVVLERGVDGVLGRFTESLFRGVEDHTNERLAFLERIVGDFTLAKRAAGFEHVLMVGTGTGLAPFVSMIKQLHVEAQQGAAPPARYTLLHANRTWEELAYHSELLEIEKAKSFDFVYVPSVSRPTARDLADPQLGSGRANNLLRHLFGLPAKEPAAFALALPRERPLAMLRERIEPSRTVVLTCGNPNVMADIAWIASQAGMRFEKEDW